MPHPQPIITFVSALDWPEDDDELEDVSIQCAGRSYLSYESRLLDRRTFLHGSSFRSSSSGVGAGTSASASAGANDDDDDDDDAAADGKKKPTNKKEYDLLTMSDRKLKKLSYYQVLSRSLPMHATPDEIRRAYHRACLRYHPDKTGRDEEDEVFLLVKAAFDTLSDGMKRRSYDSTVDFDEGIPKEGVSESDFYAEYGPVFERNLRFASCNDPMNQIPGGGGGGEAPPVATAAARRPGRRRGRTARRRDRRPLPPPPNRRARHPSGTTAPPCRRFTPSTISGSSSTRGATSRSAHRPRPSTTSKPPTPATRSDG